MSAGTLAALDDAIRAHVRDLQDEGEVIVSWVVAAATRTYDHGGAVLTAASDDSMPQWEARGILATALRTVSRVEDEDQG